MKTVPRAGVGFVPKGIVQTSMDDIVKVRYNKKEYVAGIGKFRREEKGGQHGYLRA